MGLRLGTACWPRILARAGAGREGPMLRLSALKQIPNASGASTDVVKSRRSGTSLLPASHAGKPSLAQTQPRHRRDTIVCKP